MFRCGRGWNFANQTEPAQDLTGAKDMERVLLLLFLQLPYLVVLLQSTAAGPLPPFNLRCDRNLVGLSPQQLKTLHHRHLFATDSKRPRLSWNLAHSEREAGGQHAFRVVVARDVEFSELVWDSGMVNSDQQEVLYGGSPLTSGRVYLWRVSWWDQKGVQADSVEVGHFLTGVLNPEEWDGAKWLAIPTAKTSVVLSTKIRLKGKVSQATLHLCGLGYFRATVNGVDLHRRADPPIYLAPGWTHYAYRVPYMTFSITELIKGTTIDISVVLGVGWRDPSQYNYHNPTPPQPDSYPYIMRAFIDVLYSRGNNKTGQFYTDATWTGAMSAFSSDSIYNGETYHDGFKSTLLAPAVVDGPSGEMYLPTFPYIAETATVQAVSIKNHPTDSTKQIVDFGTNSAGVCKLNTQSLGSAGPITMKHAEVLQHPPYGPADGTLYYGNLRSAAQLDTVYPKSSPFYQPTFTYHGFRYVEVTGYPRKLTTQDITKVEVHSAVKANGNFNTNVALLKQIQEAVERGQLSNFMSVATDCDQRSERMGWMGDAGLSSDSMAINFDMDAFFMNYLQLIADEQSPTDPSVPDIVPFCGARRPADPSWGSAFANIAWVLMKQYKNLDAARNFFPNVYRYIMFENSQVSSGGIGHIPGRYGDWCPPPPMKKVSTSLASAFSYLLNVKQLGEIAEAIGDTANATYFKDLFNKQAGEFNDFFLSSDGKYLDDLQISYVLPLYLDIVPANMKDKITTYFINKLTTSDNMHITAGIIGTKFILPTLTRLNQHEKAMTIVTQTDYPSWGYMLNNGIEDATTIWELWNSLNGSAGMDSRNHHMFSSVSQWIRTESIGLSQAESSYGYEELELHPARGLMPSEASASMDYPRPLSFSWKRLGGVQCGKAPEDRSPSTPNLAQHGGLSLSCGEGVIGEVLFASYGNPTGYCGYHRRGDCHDVNSESIVEKLCLNKTSCTVPTRADYWGDVCRGRSRWLSVAVQCRSSDLELEPDHVYSSLHVDVSVPVGSHANLHLPAYGKSSLRVWEGEEMVYSGQRLLSTTPGILSGGWEKNKDSLHLKLGSGDYSFVVRGSSPAERHCVESTANQTSLKLHCMKEGHTVSRIVWASYGDPSSCAQQPHSLGSCHSGASVMVAERECLGKQPCELPVLEETFGGSPCPVELQDAKTSDEWRLVEYVCNLRV